MRTKRWMLGVAGALVIGGGTLMIPSPSSGDHGNALDKNKTYAGSVSPSTINVTCAVGATTGSASVSVSAVHSGSGGSTGTASGPDEIRVTWSGGTGSVSLTSFNSSQSTPGGATFPCPPTNQSPGSGTFTFQTRKNGGNQGTAASVSVTYNRVGSAS